VRIETGCSVGAMTLVNKNLDSWNVFAGCPAKKLKSRYQSLLTLESQYLEGISKND
jgi:acetyltransferase-like isoleucine patch superfamily enzyme